MAPSSTSGATDPSQKRHRRQGAAVVAPPPSSPPRPYLSASSSSSSSSTSASSVALTALPIVLTTLLDEFLGVAGRRPLAHSVSRALRETEAKKCTESACLASPVSRLCVDGCVLRGERLLAQGYALDAGVTDAFRFRRVAPNWRPAVRFQFVDDALVAQQRSRSDAKSGEKPRGEEEEEEEQKAASTAERDGTDGVMRITFSLRGWKRENAVDDAQLTADALEWEALYAPEPEPSAIAREITAEIAREERRQRDDEAARDWALRQGKPPPPRRQLIDVLAGLRRLRSLYRPLSDFGRLMRELARRYQRSESKLKADDARERTRVKAAWRAATGHAFKHKLPDAAEWPRIYHVPWVAYVLHAVFRSADETRGWRIRFAHDLGVVLFGRVPTARVGVVMRRLLSEPTAIFNELALEQPRETRVSLRDPAAATTTRAFILVLRGIRVWRGSDIVASRFRVVDESVIDDDYAASMTRVATVQAEFARLFPPQPTPFVTFGAPAPDDEKKRAAVAAPGEEENG